MHRADPGGRWTVLVLALLLARCGAAETYLVGVGLDRYDRDYAVSTLNYAVADVKAVAQALRESGVPERNLRLLTSDQSEALARPTAANVLEALTRAARRCEPGDTLIFMFSGHGLQAGDTSYLLTAETDPDRLDRTSLRLQEARDALAEAHGANVLLLLDACRNEPRKAKGGGDAALDERFAKGMALWPRAHAAVLLACDVGQRAWEDPDAGHGAFTRFLLQGLEGAAREPDGSVRVGRLAEYVTGAVSTWAARHGQQQTPRFERPAGLEFVVLRPGATLTLPPNWPDYLGRWRTKLPPQLRYRLRPRDDMPQVLIPAGDAELGSPPEQIERACQLGRAMLEAQGGTFDRATVADQGPRHRVTLDAYWLDLHTVTNAQFARFLNSRQPDETTRKEWVALAGEVVTSYLAPQLQLDGARYVVAAGKDLHPAIYVSWYGANAYAQWVGAALPTEAQWERAARGGLAGQAYVWGDSDTPPPGAGNFCDETTARRFPEFAPRACHVFGYEDSFDTTSPVGEFRPNGLGLCDMVGNVWQWCEDWYAADAYAKRDARNPRCTSPGTHRVLRGGAWAEELSALRVATRGTYEPATKAFDAGFRCAEAP